MTLFLHSTCRHPATSTSRQENVFSGQLTNLAVGLHEMQCSVRIRLLLQLRCNRRHCLWPLTQGYTRTRQSASSRDHHSVDTLICWSNTAGFVGLFAMIQSLVILREIEVLGVGPTHSLAHLRNSSAFNKHRQLIVLRVRCVYFRFVYVLYTLRYSADMHRQPVLPADETVISVTQPCTY